MPKEPIRIGRPGIILRLRSRPVQHHLQMRAVLADRVRRNLFAILGFPSSKTNEAQAALFTSRSGGSQVKRGTRKADGRAVLGDRFEIGVRRTQINRQKVRLEEILAQTLSRARGPSRRAANGRNPRLCGGSDSTSAAEAGWDAALDRRSRCGSLWGSDETYKERKSVLPALSSVGPLSIKSLIRVGDRRLSVRCVISREIADILGDKPQEGTKGRLATPSCDVPEGQSGRPLRAFVSW